MLLDSYSYQRVIERGFTVIRGPDQRPITRSAQVTDGTSAKIEFADGERSAIIGKAPEKLQKNKIPINQTMDGNNKKQERLL
jgi:exodeoxyribonuclease VII large subunit